MPASLLVVCHANLCRSPMAAALLAQRMPEWQVLSAGIAARDGAPADPRACAALRAHGLDLAAHRARLLDAALCAQAALVRSVVAPSGRRMSTEPNFTSNSITTIGPAKRALVRSRSIDPIRRTNASLVGTTHSPWRFSDSSDRDGYVSRK